MPDILFINTNAGGKISHYACRPLLMLVSFLTAIAGKQVAINVKVVTAIVLLTTYALF